MVLGRVGVHGGAFCALCHEGGAVAGKGQERGGGWRKGGGKESAGVVVGFEFLEGGGG